MIEIQRRPEPDLSLLPDSIPAILKRIYINRGITDVAQLETSARGLHAYQQLGGIDQAVELLFQAINEQKRIIVVGDFDADGATGNGQSEEMLWKALKKLDKETREKVIIGSKIVPNKCGDVRKECLATLKRLDMESLDLYMVHWPISANSMGHFKGGKTHFGDGQEVDESEVPNTKTTFTELKKLQEEGLIKHIGVSNFGAKQL